MFCLGLIGWAFNGLFFLAPLVALPLALGFSFYLMIRLSLAFVLFHLVTIAMKKFVPTLFTNLRFFAYIMQALVLLGLGVFVQPHLPKPLEATYSTLISWSGPIFLMVQAVQVVRLIMFFSKAMQIKMYLKPTVMQAIMLTIAIASYVISGVIVYYIFQDNLTVGLSSYISIICTVLVGLTVANVVIEEAIITDVALLSLFLTIFARITVATAASYDGTHADTSESEPFLTFLLGTTFNNVNHLLSLEFLISSAIALITLTSLPFPLPLDEDSWLLNDSARDEDSANDMNVSIRPNVFAIGAIMMYSQLVLTATGNIEPVALWWRHAASIVTVLFYTYKLLASSQHFHSD